jgi:phage-related protein
MAADGSVIIDVLLDDDGVTRGMDGINNSVSNLKGIAKTVAASLAVVGAAAGAAFVGFSKSAIVAAADAKALNAQFDSVFKEVGKTATTSLNKIADETGILPNRLKGAFTQMAAFAKTTGLDTAAALSLTERATLAAADSAAFYDKSIESTAETLQSFLKGNFENDAALGISATETTRNAKANELYGKSFTKLSESQKQDTLLAMVEAGNQLSGALGQAAKESDGLENLLGNLKSAWNDLLIQFGTPILPIVTDWLQKIASAIQSFDATPFINAFKFIWDSLDKFASSAVDIYKTIKSSISSSGGLLEALGIDASFLAKLYGYLVKAQETFKHVFDGIKTVVKQAFTFIMNNIVPILSDVVNIMMDNLNMVQEIFTAAFDAVIAVVSYAFEFIQTYIVPILNDIVSFIGEQLEVIRKFWAENGEQIVEAVTKAFNMVKSVIDFIMPAVLFVIDFVWTAIKQVITGALDIIMGLIKVFSGLFTGDFGKMWEGIKQIFFGAIDLIIGWMSLTFVGGLRTLLTNLAKAGFNLLKGMWDDIAKVFTNMGATVGKVADDMANAIVKYFTGLKDKAASIWGTMRTFGASVWSSIKTVIVNFAKNIWDDVVAKFTGLVSSVKNIFGTVKSVISDIWGGVLTFFKGINLTQIGKDIIAGLIKGIGSMASALTEKVKSLASSVEETTKKVLGIHSPSRVMDALGKFTIDGLNQGMESRKKTTEKITKEIADVAVKSTKESNKEVQALVTEQEKEIAKVLKDSQVKQAKIVADGKASKKKNTVKVNEELKKVEQTTAEQIEKINLEHSKKVAKIDSDRDQSKLDAMKKYIENKKSLDQLSMLDEAKLWETTVKHFKDGTQQKIDAQKQYYTQLKTINDQIISINTEYSNRIIAVNDQLRQNEQKMTDEYNKSVEERTKALSTFASLFDWVDNRVALSGKELTQNLASQVHELGMWQSEFNALSKKAIDDGLLEELRQMGVKAYPELVELNKMTESELTDYSNLYKLKASIARKQAETEMVGMKNDTAKKIAEMRTVANAELTKLEKEWQAKIANITKVTGTELNSLKAVGKNAGKGLLDGLSSMEDSLVSKARSIAESIKRTISGALDIHSPSRWMRDFVAGNMAQGWIKGIDENEKSIIKKASQFGDWMKPEVSGGFVNKLRGVAAPLRNVTPIGPTTGGSSNTTNQNSKTFSPKITNHFTPAESTPSESARKQKQQLQRAAMEWR